MTNATGQDSSSRPSILRPVQHSLLPIHLLPIHINKMIWATAQYAMERVVWVYPARIALIQVQSMSHFSLSPHHQTHNIINNRTTMSHTFNHLLHRQTTLRKTHLQLPYFFLNPQSPLLQPHLFHFQYILAPSSHHHPNP